MKPWTSNVCPSRIFESSSDGLHNVEFPRKRPTVMTDMMCSSPTGAAQVLPRQNQYTNTVTYENSRKPSFLPEQRPQANARVYNVSAKSSRSKIPWQLAETCTLPQQKLRPQRCHSRAPSSCKASQISVVAMTRACRKSVTMPSSSNPRFL